LSVRGNSFFDNTLKVYGPFVQESSGVLDLTILNHDNSRTGDMVIVDRNNAELGGKALVRVNGNGDWDLNTFTILRVLSNGQGQAVSGQFETVELRRSGPAMRISPIPEMIYLDDRVDVALYCKADVNRNGSIEPTDFAAWIGAYQNNSDLADVNEDGNLTQADFSSWINYYSMPCGN
ncbi:MAG: GC-type dockerin domain-anchored protein, partial [Phycisphaerales bacterium JB061]